MTKWLISFPSGEMDVPEGEWQTVVEESHAVVRQAKEAGVWVFGGGIAGHVPADASARGRLLDPRPADPGGRVRVGGADRGRVPLRPGGARVRG
jgi:hypothetical protein